jgi:hypothetical protein
MITLACIDCVNPELAVKALEVCGLKVPMLLFSHREPVHGPEIKWIEIPRLTFQTYQLFVLKHLHKYIDTSHVLTVQTDGFVLRPELWDKDWLEYDYIGAPWEKKASYAKKTRVGNSGFCLRSKRFLETVAGLTTDEALENNKWSVGLLDDIFTCNDLYDALINIGMRFAPPEVAVKFSIELPTEYGSDINTSFGYHGRFHPPTDWLMKQVDTPTILMSVNYYKTDDKIRQAELDRCLFQNAKVADLTCLINPGVTVPHHTVITADRATFYEMFDSINKGPGLKIVINADCWMDETVNVLQQISEGQFACLTRHEREPDGTWRLWENGGHLSQDVWAWKGVLRFNAGTMKLGTMGCDNHLAWLAREAKYEVINPSKSVRVFHEHSQAQRSALERVKGKYLFVWPHKIDEQAKIRIIDAPSGDVGPRFRLQGKEQTYGLPRNRTRTRRVDRRK